MRLVRRMRTAILAGEYKDFTKRFMDKMFPGVCVCVHLVALLPIDQTEMKLVVVDGNYPAWSVEALSAAGIQLSTKNCQVQPDKP